jgi:hypothetical protein
MELTGIQLFCYWLDGRSSIPGRSNISLFSTVSSPSLGPTKPPTRWVQGSVSPKVKRTARKADHTLPSSSEFNNGGAVPPLPHMSSWQGA